MNRAQRRRQAKRSKPVIASTIDLRHFKLQILPLEYGIENNCYAKTLENCNGGISREHYISENILNHFPGIASKGIPWLAHTMVQLPSSALTTKCLCQRHNSYLSPLDELAGHFFTQLKKFGQNIPEHTIIPGRLLERWMLKTLIGLIATNKIAHNQKSYNLTDIDPSWIKIVFNLEEFPDGCGLHVFYLVGDQINFSNSFSIGPTFLNNELCGIDLTLGGMRFMLTLKPKGESFKTENKDFQYVLYRPTQFNKDPYPQSLKFDWS